VRRVALALPIRKAYSSARGATAIVFESYSTAPNCRCRCTETTSSKSHLVWTEMISPRTDALSGAQTASRATGLERAALCGVRLRRAAHNRTQAKKQENSLAGAARATFLAWKDLAVGEGSIPVPLPPPAWPKPCILSTSLLAKKPHNRSSFHLKLQAFNRQSRLILLRLVHFSPELWTLRIRYGSRNSNVSRVL
jgi:hypothetical protein